MIAVLASPVAHINILVIFAGTVNVYDKALFDQSSVLPSANDTLEFDELCKNPVINLMSDQSLEDMGGTQRLGDYECQLNPGTHAYRLYGKEMIDSRSRELFFVNTVYIN